MIKDFIYRYFIEPMVIGSGYNTINTFSYAILFLVFVFIAGFILKKIKLKIDREFFLAVTPYIISACFIRVLEDAGIMKSYFLMTPFIWLMFFFVITFLLIISSLIQKKFGILYYKIMFISGLFIIGITSGMLIYRNLIAIFYVLVWFIPFLLLISLIDWSIENKLVSSVQIFDAVTTFVSMKYFGYSEQHVVPNLIMNLTGSKFSFVIVKLIVVIFALKVIDKETEDKNLRALLKFCIAILGFGPGLRDFIRLIAFV